MYIPSFIPRPNPITSASNVCGKCVGSVSNQCQDLAYDTCQHSLVPRRMCEGRFTPSITRTRMRVIISKLVMNNHEIFIHDVLQDTCADNDVID